MDISEQLAAEAHDVMARAFVAVRGSARAAMGMHGGMDARTTATLFQLADALHNLPAWLHPDPSRRMICSEGEMRRELERARRLLGDV